LSAILYFLIKVLFKLDQLPIAGDRKTADVATRASPFPRSFIFLCVTQDFGMGRLNVSKTAISTSVRERLHKRQCHSLEITLAWFPEETARPSLNQMFATDESQSQLGYTVSAVAQQSQ
jgi:hypothetical protein